MSVPDTAVSTRRKTVPYVRNAVPADHPAIREVVIAAYSQYAGLIAPDIFSRYLAGLLDLETHASHGRLLVAEAAERVCGFAAFYPDALVQGFGWPPGWAGGRGLAVDPAVRGHGVARALLATFERLAHDCGAPVFAFHTASFMTSAIALYERLGYRRAPEFDFDMAARFGRSGAAPITAIAYLRHLTRTRARVEVRRAAITMLGLTDIPASRCA
jgi:GNAT superfamily N-acetyltransferase